jgi:hypothetical protein
METLFTEVLSMPYISKFVSEMGVNGITGVQEVLSVTHDEAEAS